MEEPVLIFRIDYRKQVDEAIKKNNLNPDDFIITKTEAVFRYNYKKTRLYFNFTLYKNNFDTFNVTYSRFNHNFSPQNFMGINGNPKAMQFSEAVKIFANWIVGEVFVYINEIENNSKNALDQLAEDSAPNIQTDFYAPISLEELRKIGAPSKGDEIVHKDDEGKPLTLPQLIEAFDSSERTNRSTGRTLTQTSHYFENEKQKNQDLQRQISENKKSVSYWLTLSLLVSLFTYINFTAHFILGVTFNLLITAIIEIIMLGLLSILFFKEKSERRNIAGSIISTIVGTAIIFLAGIIAKNYGLI